MENGDFNSPHKTEKKTTDHLLSEHALTTGCNPRVHAAPIQDYAANASMLWHRSLQETKKYGSATLNEVRQSPGNLAATIPLVLPSKAPRTAT